MPISYFHIIAQLCYDEKCKHAVWCVMPWTTTTKLSKSSGLKGKCKVEQGRDHNNGWFAIDPKITQIIDVYKINILEKCHFFFCLTFTQLAIWHKVLFIVSLATFTQQVKLVPHRIVFFKCDTDLLLALPCERQKIHRIWHFRFLIWVIFICGTEIRYICDRWQGDLCLNWQIRIHVSFLPIQLILLGSKEGRGF